MNQNPIYLDWTFWSAIVALLALVLSQMPPIYQLIRRAKLTMEVYSRAAIAHKVGYPNVQLTIGLSNIGGRGVKIKGLTVVIYRENERLLSIPAQTFSPLSEPTKQLLYTGIKIKPNEEWFQNIYFVLDLNRSQERDLKDKTLAMMEDINQKKALPENKNILIEAEQKNVQPFYEMLNKNFIWTAGEYEMRVQVDSSDSRTNIEKRFRFTIYESDERQLLNDKDKYKYGDTIFWDSGNHWLFVKISEA